MIRFWFRPAATFTAPLCISVQSRRFWPFLSPLSSVLIVNKHKTRRSYRLSCFFLFPYQLTHQEIYDVPHNGMTMCNMLRSKYRPSTSGCGRWQLEGRVPSDTDCRGPCEENCAYSPPTVSSMMLMAGITRWWKDYFFNFSHIKWKFCQFVNDFSMRNWPIVLITHSLPAPICLDYYQLFQEIVMEGEMGK